MPKVEEPNDRVREQIEEILEETERKVPTPIRSARPVAPRKVRSGTPIWYPTPEKLIVAGLILMIAAVISRTLVLPLTIGGFAIAGIGYYMIIARKRRTRYGSSTGGFKDDSPKYWRGKPVKPSAPAKKRDGNIIEFPGADEDKGSGRFGRKK